MNENIKKYLSDNKDEFSKESLISALEKGGYNRTDIAEGVSAVYRDESSDTNILIQSVNFWDFKNYKIYAKRSEKIKDFFFGLALPWLFGILSAIISFSLRLSFSSFLSFLSFIFYIILLFYFSKRRRFIFWGLISNILFGLALGILAFILITTIFS